MPGRCRAACAHCVPGLRSLTAGSTFNSAARSYDWAFGNAQHWYNLPNIQELRIDLQLPAPAGLDVNLVGAGLACDSARIGCLSALSRKLMARVGAQRE